MSAANDAIQFAHEAQDRALEDLKDFLSIPSVSTLPEHKDDIERAAHWLTDRLEHLDFKAIEILPTGNHPVVYGEHMGAGEQAPTLLVYGHYDVQPSDPDELWETPPFEPTVRGENLYARGASDMKGQVMAHLMAVEAMLATSGLPINVKYFFEGEEEVGSPSLRPFIEDHQEKLAADLCLNLDAGILDAETPSITYALRGLVYLEIRLQGTEGDLHSGRYGGVVDNPALVLAHLLDGMKDREGHILLPGFYDNVRSLDENERADLAKLPQDEEWWKEQAGAEELFGEPEFTPTERATARPTLDVNGLLSGFTGEGSKTVLPARAMAKVSMRLVPDQDPARIEEIFRQYLEGHVPETMSWELLSHSSSLPGILEREAAPVQAAARAFHAVWGKQPLYTREGGTVPIVAYLKEIMDLDSLLVGFGLPDDQIHAPNEKLHLPSYYRGIETLIHLTQELAVD